MTFISFPGQFPKHFGPLMQLISAPDGNTLKRVHSHIIGLKVTYEGVEWKPIELDLASKLGNTRYF